MKQNDPKRIEQLSELIKEFPKLWKWPTFKFSKDYPHHNDGECARRRNQQQHRNQVQIDLSTKSQVT